METRAYALSLDTLEMACGFDGLLRGKPEPVLVWAAYLVQGDKAVLTERRVVELEPPSSFPGSCKPAVQKLLSGVMGWTMDPPKLLILGLALERDGGMDVARVFGLLERHDQLMVWRENLSSTLSLVDCAAEPGFTHPRPVSLMVEGHDLADMAHSDKWVGAALCVATPQDHALLFRFPFLSRDSRNDWTALVELRA